MTGETQPAAKGVTPEMVEAYARALHVLDCHDAADEYRREGHTPPETWADPWLPTGIRQLEVLRRRAAVLAEAFEALSVSSGGLAVKAQIVAAMKQSFQDVVAGSSGKLFEDTGVTMPGDHVWERYAAAALSVLDRTTLPAAEGEKE